MLLNYFKIAWRSITRNKFFSTLNIMGMALGIACSLMIMLWVQHELSIDSYHANKDRLYQLYAREYYENVPEGSYETSGLIADELKKNIPEVEYAAMMADENSEATFQSGNKKLRETGLYAGSDIFNMFSLPLIQGTPATALVHPDYIAISRNMAMQFFNSPEAAIGQPLKLNNEKSYVVNAVFENLPSTSSLQFDYVISWQAYLAEKSWAGRWDNTGPHAYVLLKKGTDVKATEKKVKHFLRSYIQENSSFRVELGLQSFSETYLYNHFKDGYIDGGRIEYVRLFSIVAFFILLIACINFMNLTTARSAKRAREIGVRKVSGALRSTLIWQFIGESVMVTAIAVGIAVFLVVALLPWFNSITLKAITIPFSSPAFWLQLLAITLITGILAGSYPALFLSSFQPVRILKGVISNSKSALSLRKMLVIFQFSLSVLLITGTIVVSRQVNYIQHKNLGYDRSFLVEIPIEGELPKQYALFKEKAMQLAGVAGVTRMEGSATNHNSFTTSIEWANKRPNQIVSFAHLSVGYDFTKTLKLQLTEGRDFSRDYPAGGFLLNETAVKAIGYTYPVIGKEINMWGAKSPIIGVIKDFHFRSLHSAIPPMIIYQGATAGHIMVRTEPGKTKEALSGLEALCKELNPAFPFTYAFTDEQYRQLYRSEEIVGTLSVVFAGLAIFISCLGLLGLAIYSAEQRKKEVSIRKVLGASIQSLFILLSREFLWLVFFAMLIATPLSWWIMNNWLNDFAYKALIDWQIFFFAGLIALTVALATVSVQAIKAALLNPVKSLKSE